jgi:hypothetical protein
MGFTGKWLNWIAMLLSLAGTRVTLNGMPGARINHARGLWQGDPLSPILFLLIMEVLSALIRKADHWSLFQRLGSRFITHRASLYADDLILFISPTAQDLHLAHCIFSLFEGASGLGCNMAK